MKPKNKYLEAMKEYNEDALYPTGFEDAIIGIVYRHGIGSLFLMSMKKMIEIMVNRDKMTSEEAMEYFDFNVKCAYLGEFTPVFLEDLDGDLEELK